MVLRRIHYVRDGIKHMLKKCIAVVVFILAISVIVNSTHNPYTNTAFIEQPSTDQGDVPIKQASQNALSDKNIINIYTCDAEMERVFAKYAALHPGFDYKTHYTQDAAGAYYRELLSALQTDNGKEIDIYCVPGWYAEEFIKGEYAGYASAYKQLGIDVDSALKKADIPQYAIDAGTNSVGEIVTLPYEASVGVFMYRRSIAKKVWGTDEPDTIAEIIGTGSDNWAKFVEAAQTLKKQGYDIVPGCYGIWPLFADGIDAYDRNRIGNNMLPQKWEQFFEVSKLLYDNGCIKDIDSYTDEWVQALDGKEDKPVFGFVTTENQFKQLGYEQDLKNTAGDWALCQTTGVNTSDGTHSGIMVNKNSLLKDKIAPLIEWITLNSSKTGLQHRLANDTLYRTENVNDELYKMYGKKRTVASAAIMKNTSNCIDFLGGQNINTIIYNTIRMSNREKHQRYTSLDSAFNNEWYSIVRACLKEDKSKEMAIAEFKAKMSDIEKRHKEYMNVIY